MSRVEDLYMVRSYVIIYTIHMDEKEREEEEGAACVCW
jgi:hypothetical protein